MFNTLLSRIPAYYLVLSTLAGGVGGYFLLRETSSKPSAENQSSAVLAVSTSSNKNCEYRIARLSGYKYVKPLVFAESECESSRYQGLKAHVAQVIQQHQSQGAVTDAAVYVRDFRLGEWFSLNEDGHFHPASMIKIVALITVLRMEEENPGFLDKQFSFTPPPGIPQQTYTANSIQPGKPYSVRELLRYMIQYSDNNATYVINTNMNVNTFMRVFSDLGLENPNVADRNFQMTAHDYSVFWKALYNSAYLNIKNSELAMSWLTETSFDKGIAAGLPKGTKVAHKFGEWGDGVGGHELHDAGIVYLEGLPYMVVIMTKGTKMETLPEVVSSIAKTVHEGMVHQLKGTQS